MNVFVAVNRVEEIGYRQTTSLLAAALVRLGHTVSLVGVGDFSVDTARGVQAISNADHSNASFIAHCKTVPPSSACDSEVIDDFAKSESMLGKQAIEAGDLILIRTNPGRDTDRAATHDSFLDLCRAAKVSGIRFVNDPSHLRYFASKACLAGLEPNYCPPMIVSQRVDLIVDFVRRSGTDCVVKPAMGSRGQNVIRVRHDDDSLEARVSSVFQSGSIVAQHFVNADHAGDKRVVVLCGKLLQVDGHLAGIERRPAADDFRANLHAGGTAHPLTLSDSATETAEYAAKLLYQHGIVLAGIDLIGDKIIEFNVFSTGGLFDAESYAGVSFSDEIARQIVG